MRNINLNRVRLHYLYLITMVLNINQLNKYQTINIKASSLWVRTKLTDNCSIFIQ